MTLSYVGHEACWCWVESSKSKELNRARNDEDDSDVLIECRGVYKSFGKKKNSEWC